VHACKDVNLTITTESLTIVDMDNCDVCIFLWSSAILHQHVRDMLPLVSQICAVLSEAGHFFPYVVEIIHKQQFEYAVLRLTLFISYIFPLFLAICYVTFIVTSLHLWSCMCASLQLITHHLMPSISFASGGDQVGNLPPY